MIVTFPLLPHLGAIGQTSPTQSGAIAAVSLIIAAITGLWVAFGTARHNARSDATATYAATIDGMQRLLAALQSRASDLEEESQLMKSELRLARSEAHEANAHAARCDVALAAAQARIAVLEGRTL